MPVASEIKHMHALSILWPENNDKEKRIRVQVCGRDQCGRLFDIQHPQKPKDKGEKGMLSGIESKALWVRWKHS